MTLFLWLQSPTLMVKNLPSHILENDLRSLFNYYSNNGVVKITKQVPGVVYVDFASILQADAAKLALDQKNFKGNLVDVKWFRPMHQGGGNIYAQGRKSTERRDSFRFTRT